MKRPWKIMTGLILVIGIVGILVVVSGVIPVKASSGNHEVVSEFYQRTVCCDA